jgi:type II secretion system protein H
MRLMRPRSHQHGFTLIEILVTVTIIGIIIGVAVLSMNVGGEDEALDTERRRLAGLIETIQNEGMLQGREFGIEFMVSAYRFVEFDPLTRQWAEVPADELYRLRELPEGLEFELYVEGRRVELDDDPRRLADPDENSSSTLGSYTPHVFVFASGESTIYELSIWRPATDSRLVMRGDILGQIEFGEVDEI